MLMKYKIIKRKFSEDISKLNVNEKIFLNIWGSNWFFKYEEYKVI